MSIHETLIRCLNIVCSRPRKSMLALLWECLIGLIVGALGEVPDARERPGRDFITMAIGIAGSIGATFLGQAIGWYRQGQSAGFLMSAFRRDLLLWIYRLVKARTAA